MNATLTTVQSVGQIARPLKILVPLIKEDLRQGNEAAEQAGMPYYRAAGEKMLEAREGTFQGKYAEFQRWIRDTFNISTSQSQRYMKLASTTTDALRARVTSLRDFDRYTGRDNRPTGGAVRRDWQPDVDALAEKARAAQQRIENLDQDRITRQQEREAERALALKLIDIGYKVLAKELHPDKGGSRAAMQRLVIVRDRLKTHA